MTMRCCCLYPLKKKTYRFTYYCCCGRIRYRYINSKWIITLLYVLHCWRKGSGNQTTSRSAVQCMPPTNTTYMIRTDQSIKCGQLFSLWLGCNRCFSADGFQKHNIAQRPHVWAAQNWKWPAAAPRFFVSRKQTNPGPTAPTLTRSERHMRRCEVCPTYFSQSNGQKRPVKRRKKNIHTHTHNYQPSCRCVVCIPNTGGEGGYKGKAV